MAVVTASPHIKNLQKYLICKKSYLAAAVMHRNAFLNFSFYYDFLKKCFSKIKVSFLAHIFWFDPFSAVFSASSC